MKTVRYLSPAGNETWCLDGGQWRSVDSVASGFVWLVTDLPEESFVEIKTPRLFGKDRSAFIDRQLAARYPESPYRRSLPVEGGELFDRLAPTRHVLFGVDAGERIDAEIEALPQPIAAVSPVSLLLARLARHRELPPNLFVVMPGQGSLRIVFLRERTPVLTRLTLTPGEPKAQIDEIMRTLRHLENNLGLPRNLEHAVLLLGDANGVAPLMSTQRLRLVELPKYQNQPPADWRFPLFDLAIKEGTPQVAPMDKRVNYVSSRLGRAARVMAVVIALAGIGAVGSNLGSILSLIAQERGIAASIQKLDGQIAAVEAEIEKYGVAPNMLRDAIAIHDREIASVPPLEAGFRLVADAISADPALRLSELQLRLILPSANTCGVDLTSEDGMKRPEATAPGVAKRRIEIGFDLTIPGSYGPRERAQTARLVSRRLTDVGGLSLWTDANKELSAGNLRGGTTVNAASRQGWCFTVPGMPAEEAMPAQEKRT